jgi:hypothetical protein
LHGIATRRHPLPGEVEDLDAPIAAAAILEPLAPSGWGVVRRPGFGSKSASTPP